jgi:hypothetical protein
VCFCSASLLSISGASILGTVLGSHTLGVWTGSFREESDKPGRLGALFLQSRDFRVGPPGLGDAPQCLPLPSGVTGKPR